MIHFSTELRLKNIGGALKRIAKKRTVGLRILAGSLFVFPLTRILCCVERTGG